MIIILNKIEKSSEIITRLSHKYHSKKRLIDEYEKNNDPLLFLDLEDWNYFEKHPDETQEHGKTIITNNFDLDNDDLKIISYLKHEKKPSTNKLSENLECSVDEVNKRFQN